MDIAYLKLRLSVFPIVCCGSVITILETGVPRSAAGVLNDRECFAYLAVKENLELAGGS